MNDHNIDKTEEETLLDEVSDEALEIAAGAGRMAGMAGTWAGASATNCGCLGCTYKCATD
jgi:hypothetical protein